MRYGSPELVAALDGSLPNVEYVADVFSVSGVRLLQDVPLTDVRPVWDAGALVEASAEVTIIHEVSDESWIPEQPGDKLAPFGRELDVAVVVSVAGQDERVQLGRFVIDEVVETQAEVTHVTGERVVVAEKIVLSLVDRMADVVRDRFTAVTAPGSVTCWAEIERLVPFAVLRSMPDKALLSRSPYDESRASAVQDIARVLGGDAHFTSDGRLTVRPDAPGVSVAVLEIGEYGKLSPLKSPLTREGVYNIAVVRGKKPESSDPIQAVATVTDGALSPAEYRRAPVFYESDKLTTPDQVAAYAPTLLAEKSRPRARVYEAVALWNPLLEVGDVVTVREQGVADRDLRLTYIAPSYGLMQVRGVLV